jgi:hypothetical protein
VCILRNIVLSSEYGIALKYVVIKCTDTILIASETTYVTLGFNNFAIIIITALSNLLILLPSYWVVVLESKKTILSVWSALPQTLAYLMASPNTNLPNFGMLTNGDDIVFVKLENQHYSISRVFAPLSTQSELESACQVLYKIAEIVK